MVSEQWCDKDFVTIHSRVFAGLVFGSMYQGAMLRSAQAVLGFNEAWTPPIAKPPLRRWSWRAMRCKVYASLAVSA